MTKAYIHLLSWLSAKGINVTVSQGGFKMVEDREPLATRQLIMEAEHSILTFTVDGETNAAHIYAGVRPDESVEVVTGDTLLQWKYQYIFHQSEMTV